MLIAIDEHDPRPIYVQIVGQMKEQIQNGDLKPGDELPPVRDLADSLGINLHTVRAAYKTLHDQRLIDLRLGRRAKVAKLRQKPAGAAEVDAVLARRLEELITDAFLLGLSAEDFRRLVDRLLRQPADKE